MTFHSIWFDIYFFMRRWWDKNTFKTLHKPNQMHMQQQKRLYFLKLKSIILFYFKNQSKKLNRPFFCLTLCDVAIFWMLFSSRSSISFRFGIIIRRQHLVIFRLLGCLGEISKQCIDLWHAYKLKKQNNYSSSCLKSC